MKRPGPRKPIGNSLRGNSTLLARSQRRRSPGCDQTSPSSWLAWPNYSPDIAPGGQPALYRAKLASRFGIDSAGPRRKYPLRLQMRGASGPRSLRITSTTSLNLDDWTTFPPGDSSRRIRARLACRVVGVAAHRNSEVGTASSRGSREANECRALRAVVLQYWEFQSTT